MNPRCAHECRLRSHGQQLLTLSVQASQKLSSVIASMDWAVRRYPPVAGLARGIEPPYLYSWKARAARAVDAIVCWRPTDFLFLRAPGAI